MAICKCLLCVDILEPDLASGEDEAIPSSSLIIYMVPLAFGLQTGYVPDTRIK